MRNGAVAGLRFRKADPAFSYGREPFVETSSFAVPDNLAIIRAFRWQRKLENSRSRGAAPWFFFAPELIAESVEEETAALA